MTLALDQAMAAIPNLVYIGEDVTHGGYYLVTGTPSHSPAVLLLYLFPRPFHLFCTSILFLISLIRTLEIIGIITILS